MPKAILLKTYKFIKILINIIKIQAKFKTLNFYSNHN